MVYGIPQTINTAYYVLFLALKELTTSFEHTSYAGKKDLETIFAGMYLRRPTSPINEDIVLLTDELVSLHRGQGLDILWRDTFQCPSQEEYISMANGSTYLHVSLFRRS
jgi:geranylgeranyl diphosphate synthase type 3